MKQPRSDDLRDVLDAMGDGYTGRIDLDVSTETLMGGALSGLGEHIGSATEVAACADVIAMKVGNTGPMGRLVEVLRAMAEEMSR